MRCIWEWKGTLWIRKQMWSRNCLSKSGCLKPPLSTGEMQWAAQPSGDLWEDSGGAGARGYQAHEVHVLSGEGVRAGQEPETWEGPHSSRHRGLDFCAMFIHLANTLWVPLTHPWVSKTDRSPLCPYNFHPSEHLSMFWVGGETDNKPYTIIFRAQCVLRVK